MQGMVELGEEIFHMPVRIGVPAYAGGLAEVVRNPRYATAIGLLLEGRDQWARAEATRTQSAGISGVAEADEAVVQGEFLTRGRGRGLRRSGASQGCGNGTRERAMTR